ncbi:hypothetical protein [Paenirhodobacter enshiensis]|uniref:hypothetical protein n=1 Tax=Paenirhodobacter enshiensis TaxID=1105367 RepID=UPI0035AF47F7
MARRALILAMSTAARRGDSCHLRRQNEFLKDQRAPFSVAGIENKFGDWCDAAGLKGRSLPGVRKGLSSLLASKGAPSTKSDVLLGHEMGSPETKVYIRTAERAALAESVVNRLDQIIR